MWNQERTGITVQRSKYGYAFIDHGDEFESLKAIASDWHEIEALPSVDDVNRERDRRLAADFEFQGKMYQRDTVSLQRIAGKATLAGFAIAAGAQSGNLRWDNPERDFGWISSDNTITPMDAQTCFAFAQAAAAVETRLVFAAKQLRDMDPIPADYTDDKWWQ